MGDTSSGSSSGHSTLHERIIKIGDDGIILQYDFTDEATDEQRQIEWRYPAKIRVSSDRSVELLNRNDLAARNLAWRENAGIPDEACGSWYFTWNAFKVECDPSTVEQDLEVFQLHNIDAVEGGLLDEPGTMEAQRLERPGDDPKRFQAVFEMDTDQIRLSRAQTDVVVSQMTGANAISLEEALDARSDEETEGTMTTTLEVDDEGRVIRRIRVSQTTILFADGTTEQQTQTVSTTRQQLDD